MKSSDTPEICPKWWVSEKPDAIKGQDLKKALTECQQAIANADKKGDAEIMDAALGALKYLNSTVDKTIKKECDKKAHKEVIQVLEKFADLIEEEVERLKEAKSDLADKDCEDDEDSKGKLFEPEYLCKMIKLLKTGKELNFSFGLDKSSPENSCLLLCRKREPDRLIKMLRSKTEFAKRLMTYGRATADGKMLQFTLSDNAKEPSQICKLAKVFLKKNPELKFKKLRVVCSSGEIAEEDMDSADSGAPQVAGGAATGELQERLKKVTAVAQTWKQTRDSVADQIAQLRKQLDTFDDVDVKSIRDRLDSVLERYPKLDFSSFAGAADKPTFDRALDETRRGVAALKSILAQDAALNTIDKNPFVKTNVVTTFDDALGRIAGELSRA